MEMQTNSGARLTAVGMDYSLQQVLGVVKQSPMVEIEVKEFYTPEEDCFCAKIDPPQHRVEVGEIVCYKHAGRAIVLLGAQTAREKILMGLGRLSVRLVSKPALKRCKLQYPSGFENTPRLIDNRPPQIPALESKDFVETLTQEPLAESVDYLEETIPPTVSHESSPYPARLARGLATERPPKPLKSWQDKPLQGSFGARTQAPPLYEKPAGEVKRNNIDLTLEEGTAEYPDHPKWAELSDYEKRNVRMAKKQHLVTNAAGNATFAPKDWREQHFQKFGIFPGHAPYSGAPRRDVMRRPSGPSNRDGHSKYPQTDRVVNEVRQTAGLYGRSRRTAPQ